MKRTRQLFYIRPLTEEDEGQFLALEARIWKAKGIETATADLFGRWLENGIFLGSFEENKLIG